MTTQSLPRLIRKSDVPAVFGFSERQIKRWIAQGKIAHVKISGRTGPVMIEVEELERMIAEATIPARRTTKSKKSTS